jgi:hypothetical protein
MMGFPAGIGRKRVNGMKAAHYFVSRLAGTYPAHLAHPSSILRLNDNYLSR